MAGPALTVTGGSEEAIHGALDDRRGGAGRLAATQGKNVTGGGVIILTPEAFGFGIGGRQANQIIVKATEQGFTVGGRTGLEAELIELRHDKSIYLILAPSRHA